MYNVHACICTCITTHEGYELDCTFILIIQISDVDTAESFLSQVISRNRPRVILFSPHRNPSLRYRLAAFTHQKTADCAFISTHQSWLNRQLLSRFKVQPGDKELLVFNEDSISEPSLHLEVSNGDSLAVATSLLKEFTVPLVRISSLPNSIV